RYRSQALPSPGQTAICSRGASDTQGTLASRPAAGRRALALGLVHALGVHRRRIKAIDCDLDLQIVVAARRILAADPKGLSGRCFAETSVEQVGESRKVFEPPRDGMAVQLRLRPR